VIVATRTTTPLNIIQALVVLTSDYVLSNPITTLNEPDIFKQVYQALGLDPDAYDIGQVKYNKVTTTFVGNYAYEFSIKFVPKGTGLDDQIFIGPPGPAGPRGVAGPVGPAGPPGPIGETGPYGGPTGPQGSTGPQGFTGATGSQGEMGSTGPQGAGGPQGATGPQGVTGIDGVTGPQGSTGIDGVIGPQGATGPQGAGGPDGVTGPQGVTGAGPQGPQGATGIDGVTGATGATGPQGAGGGGGSLYDGTKRGTIYPTGPRFDETLFSFVPTGGLAINSAIYVTWTSVASGAPAICQKGEILARAVCRDDGPPVTFAGPDDLQLDNPAVMVINYDYIGGSGLWPVIGNRGSSDVSVVSLNISSNTAASKSTILGLPPRLTRMALWNPNSSDSYVVGVSYVGSSQWATDVIRMINGYEMHKVGANYSYSAVDISANVSGPYFHIINTWPNIVTFDLQGNGHDPNERGRTGLTGTPRRITELGSYAYVTTSIGLYLYNATATVPTLIGSVASAHYLDAIAVYGNYAYTVSSSDLRLNVFDVSVPAAPVELAGITLSSGINQNIYINSVGSIAYVVSPSNIKVISLAAPAAPVEITSFTVGNERPETAIADAKPFITSGVQYLAVIGSTNELYIYDMSTPASPTLVPRIPTDTAVWVPNQATGTVALAAFGSSKRIDYAAEWIFTPGWTP
jgi:hypothetical protein